MTGLQDARTADPGNGGPRWYEKTPLGLRMADGSGRAVQGDRHPDPVAEASHWHVAEAEVLQVTGRAHREQDGGRPSRDRRHERDLCMPLTVDEAIQWKDMPADLGVEMALDGIVLAIASEMAACWPAAFANEEAVKDHLKRRTGGQTPIESMFYRDLPPCDPQDRRPLAFRYLHHGERQRWR